MKKLSHIFGKIFIIVLCGVFALNLLVPDSKFSQAEKRNLQMFPSIQDSNWDDYTASVSSWFSDQFVGRKSLLHVKFMTQKLMGERKIKDVYLAKRRLIQETSEMNEEAVAQNIEAMNAFFEAHPVNTMFLLAPNAISFHEKLLPRNASVLDQNKQMDEIFSKLNPNIARIDIRDTLNKHPDEYLYYKTDHHWTSLAAYYAMQEISEYMELDLPSLDAMIKYPLTYDFKGTLANKVGSVGLKDEIDMYVSRKNVEYMVTYVDQQEKSRTIYQSDKLKSSNPYEVFLGGNHSMVQIDVDNESTHHLLILKDSYANALIPFLIPYFTTITVVDPRYYTEDLQRVIKNQLITDVLYVYNANTFVQDTTLNDVLNETLE